ncbi:conserved hypothetical protein [Aggregatibacter segnis ATCC 33393]|uniref:Uncharacterized protein n=1 Tax=Aggregatibacter segnis ATCC 33393 TaxID=888057 RepID=E6KW86_9PAST|nr:conserved hypothetical protein [Aggregatibacter segnis ATCC 33393]
MLLDSGLNKKLHCRKKELCLLANGRLRSLKYPEFARNFLFF